MYNDSSYYSTPGRGAQEEVQDIVFCLLPDAQDDVIIIQETYYFFFERVGLCPLFLHIKVKLAYN